MLVLSCDGRPEFGTVNQLDVGCASGFLTFEAEKRGATITSFDVSGGDVVNIDPKTELAAKRPEVVKMQNGY